MNYEGLKERYINGQLVNRDLYASDGRYSDSSE